MNIRLRAKIISHFQCFVALLPSSQGRRASLSLSTCPWLLHCRAFGAQTLKLICIAVLNNCTFAKPTQFSDIRLTLFPGTPAPNP